MKQGRRKKIDTWLGTTAWLLLLLLSLPHRTSCTHTALSPPPPTDPAAPIPHPVALKPVVGTSSSLFNGLSSDNSLLVPSLRTRLNFPRPRQRQRHLLQDIDEDTEEGLAPPPALFPLTVLDLLGFACATLGLMLAAGGGIGGGGILIPTFCLIMRLPVKHAISITSVTILGGSIGNLLLNSFKRHPLHKHRGCVDWVLTLLLEPAQIGGTLVGTYLHDFLPDLALMILLLVFLLLTAWKTINNANQLYQKESLEKRLQQREAQPGEADNLIVGDASHKSGGTAATITTVQDDSYYDSFETTDDGLGGIVTTVATAISDGSECSGDDDRAPDSVVGPIAKLTLLFTVITVLSILKGTETERERQSFWISQAGLLGLLVAFVAWVRADLLKQQANGDRISSDIHWDEASTLRFPALSVFAGLVAGLFGIGT